MLAYVIFFVVPLQPILSFDIQQNWEGVGLLPQLDAQGEEGEFIGRTNMLFVPFDESEE